jgi:phosphoribosylformylglycinamidine synthase
MSNAYWLDTEEGTLWLFRIAASSAEAVEAAREFLGASEGAADLTEWDYAIGPRAEMTSSWCSNVLSLMQESGIAGIQSVERYQCYRFEDDGPFDELTEMKVFRGEKWPLPAPNRLNDDIIEDLDAYNESAGLGFDAQDLAFYKELFATRGKAPTVAELHDLSNCNSEHSRHHLFQGQFVIPNGGLETTVNQSLMDLIRLPLQQTKSTNSVLAMCDNASAIRGWVGRWLNPTRVDGPSVLEPREALCHITFTAETHNFPTGIAPFQGATTGTGGRIRDTQAIGRGGTFVAGTAGYCVGAMPSSMFQKAQRWAAEEILLRASDGASDYGNKIGEPLIQGFTRSYGGFIPGTGCWQEWLKPVMFSGGIGRVYKRDLLKSSPLSGMHIVRVGGPTYRIGIGGGAASSTGQSSSDGLLSAVQRGDAQQQNRMDRWLRACLACYGNPIVSVHDQGAGGMGNVTKEIVEDMGANITLDRVDLGDETLSDAEIWVAESQEQITALIRQGDIPLAKRIAEREGVEMRSVGTVRDTGRIQVYSRDKTRIVVDLPLKGIDPPQKTYHLPSKIPQPSPHISVPWYTVERIKAMLSKIDVCSKRFLTTKVDRSVGGLIAQQQCVGPQQIPLADVAVVAHDHFGFQGAATAIGEQPIVMLEHGIMTGVRKAVGEMISNLVWAPITDFEDIKCSVNWMWPANTPEGKASLLVAVKAMSTVLRVLGIAVDGGKDSVSMTTKLADGGCVDSPPQVVVSGYAACTDIRQVVTPGFKKCGSCVYLIRANIMNLPQTFREIQSLIRKGYILAGHDVSDGGLVACLCEMCFASEHGYGFAGDTFGAYVAHSSDDAVFVIEVAGSFDNKLFKRAEFLGKVTKKPELMMLGKELTIPIKDLRDAWERPATDLEKKQTAGQVAEQEHEWLLNATEPPTYQLPDDTLIRLQSIPGQPLTDAPRAAIIRGEGSNGDREMAAALWMAGFEVHDVTTSDLTSGRLDSMDAFQMAVFVGGFTYSDVLGAAAGWGAVLTRNYRSRRTLEAFRQRQDTLILGVCNGCQLLTSLGWVSTSPFTMKGNRSNRFESRFVTVRVEQDDDIWFRGLKDMSLGVWIAHGEGQFPPEINNAGVALCYVDQENQPTMQYPLNPNGSEGAVAGVSSSDGRVLALMPHPERCVKRWQLGWMPYQMKELDTEQDYTPWMLFFHNAMVWCKSVGV